MAGQSRTVAVSGRDLARQFGHVEHLVTALDRISLEIEDNEFFSLPGSSGCGKTTLPRPIAGFDQPTHGEVFPFDEEIEDRPPRSRLKSVIEARACAGLFRHRGRGR